MKYRCPICSKFITFPTLNKTKEGNFFPFCSQRCKLLDLGAWLDSDYRIISKKSFLKEDEPDETTNDSASM
ncbi:MAG: DNA gyrase inhibitor YacG [Planctomycetota bacterium]